MSERESVCVCEHEGIKEESECTYFHPPVLTDAGAFAFLAPVLMLPVRTGLSVFGFLILKYSHSILVVCVGSIFFMKPCTVYPGRNFERKGGYDEWLSFERSSSRYNKAHPMQKKSRTLKVRLFFSTFARSTFENLHPMQKKSDFSDFQDFRPQISKFSDTGTRPMVFIGARPT